MKKPLIAAILLLTTCTTILTAADTDWSSNYKEKNIAISLAAGFETGKTLEISAYPAVEMILLKPDLGEVSFLDLGAKLSGRVGIGFPAIDLGLGAAGTAHMGFKGLGNKETAKFLDPLELIFELGICFDFIPNFSAPVGLILNSGLNYWLEDDFALGLKYTHWHGYNGGILSAHIKFKNQKKAQKALDKNLKK